MAGTAFVTGGSGFIGGHLIERLVRDGWAVRAGPLAGIIETTWKVLRLTSTPPLSRMPVWLASQECTIDISKARSELGYQPVISREQGLAELSAA